MKVIKLWKDSGSEGGSCPALYQAESVPAVYTGTDRKPGYVVQGLALDESTMSRLDDLAPTETAVYVPPNVIDRLIEQRGREAGS